MIPRTCDNDDCDYNEHGRWEHAPGCEPMEPLTEDEKRDLVRNARPGSFLANVNLGVRR